MTYVAWIVAVVCETWTDVVVRTGTDAKKVHLNPETGRYSGVVVRLTGLCVKIT